VKRYSSFATLFRLYQKGNLVSIGHAREDRAASPYLTLWSALSSLKLARIEALSFWMTARSSAMVFAARTFRMNCFTARVGSKVSGGAGRGACGLFRELGELTRTHDDSRKKPTMGLLRIP
jgi:hypothetical protein